jgi:hypothetical protein
MVAVCVMIGLLAGCDSSSSSPSGGDTAGDVTGLVGRWAATYKSGAIQPENKILVFSANGSYLATQTPPLTENYYFYRDSGLWVVSHDTVKISSLSYQVSDDSGKTWVSRQVDSISLPYSITGSRLILVGKDTDNGSDLLRYYVKE